MLGTLLKLPLKVVRLQLKLALLPARMGARLVRHLVAADGGIPNSQEQTRHQRSTACQTSGEITKTTSTD